jgi:drug/metabolite transporter (DMT)-like permease
VLKAGLLILLGGLWAFRLAAIKTAGLSGVPVHVVVAVAALGIGVFFTCVAMWRRDWPPLDRGTLGFYGLSGMLGFLAPFALESVVAPHLPVFVFVVVIATMPIITLMLSFLVGGEKLHLIPVLSVALGFVGAMLILWDTVQTDPSGAHGMGSAWWIAIAFGVPGLYAINTVFVATRWPSRAGALHVANAQALIVAGASVLGSALAGLFGDWALVFNAPVAMVSIILGEGLALLVYLRIARDFGAIWVSFANYVSMIFAALIGTIVFGDKMTALSVFAALIIAASVALYHRRTNPIATDNPVD